MYQVLRKCLGKRGNVLDSFSPKQIEKKHSISKTHSFEIFSNYLIFSAIHKIVKLDKGGICFHFFLTLPPEDNYMSFKK